MRPTSAGAPITAKPFRLRLPYLTERPREVASRNLLGDARRITALKKTVRDDFAAVWHVSPTTYRGRSPGWCFGTSQPTELDLPQIYGWSWHDFDVLDACRPAARRVPYPSQSPFWTHAFPFVP